LCHSRRGSGQLSAVNSGLAVQEYDTEISLPHVRDYTFNWCHKRRTL